MGRGAPAVLRQWLSARGMIVVMLMRPRGRWPSAEHGKSLGKNAGGKDPIQSINP